MDQDTIDCPECSQQVRVVKLFAYPQGEQEVVQNHGSSTVTVCPGSLKPAPAGD